MRGDRDRLAAARVTDQRDAVQVHFAVKRCWQNPDSTAATSADVRAASSRARRSLFQPAFEPAEQIGVGTVEEVLVDRHRDDAAAREQFAEIRIAGIGEILHVVIAVHHQHQRKRAVAVGEPDAALPRQLLCVEAPVLRACPSRRARPPFDQASNRRPVRSRGRLCAELLAAHIAAAAVGERADVKRTGAPGFGRSSAATVCGAHSRCGFAPARQQDRREQRNGAECTDPRSRCARGRVNPFVRHVAAPPPSRTTDAMTAASIAANPAGDTTTPTVMARIAVVSSKPHQNAADRGGTAAPATARAGQRRPRCRRRRLRRARAPTRSAAARAAAR